MDWTPQDYAQPDAGLGAWDIAGIAARRVGGRVLNGVVERHLGVDDVDVAGALGMASDALVPVVKNAYSEQPGEPWYSTWGRRLKWTAAIVGTTAAVGGVCYLGWRFLGQKEEVEDEE